MNRPAGYIRPGGVPIQIESAGDRFRFDKMHPERIANVVRPPPPSNRLETHCAEEPDDHEPRDREACEGGPPLRDGPRLLDLPRPAEERSATEERLRRGRGQRDEEQRRRQQEVDRDERGEQKGDDAEDDRAVEHGERGGRVPPHLRPGGGPAPPPALLETESRKMFRSPHPPAGPCGVASPT